jgi:hypothetical protein
VSPDDHYREAERLLESHAKTPGLDDDELTALVALAQVHATLALCVHPNIVRSGIRVVNLK